VGVILVVHTKQCKSLVRVPQSALIPICKVSHCSLLYPRKSDLPVCCWYVWFIALAQCYKL